MDDNLDALDLDIGRRAPALTLSLGGKEAAVTTPATELYDEEVADRTYSSLPPSPRADASAEFGLDRSMDLGDLHSQFKRSSSPRRRYSFGRETEDETVDEFWPALSRRQTLEAGERPSFPSVSVPPPLEVQNEAPESPEIPRPVHSPDFEPGLKPDLDTPLGSPRLEVPPSKPFKETTGISLWDLLKDEDAAEHWEGWIADGKW